MDKLDKQLLLEALKKEMPEFDFEFHKTTLQNDAVKETVFINFDGTNKAPLFDPANYQGVLFSDIATEMRKKLEILADMQYIISDKLLSDTYVKDNVKLQLLNTLHNKNYLKDKPHFKVNSEISAVFYVPFDTNGHERGIIADGLLQELAIEPSELKQAAIKNMSKEIELQYMEEVSHNIATGKGEVIHGRDTDKIIEELQNGKLDKMVVLSNHSREFGAASILCNDFLKNCNQDLIILPSSTHEVMLLPYTEKLSDLKELQAIVEYANLTTVPEKDILSDNVYLFDHKAQQISIACDHFGLVPICDDTLLKLPEIISKSR